MPLFLLRGIVSYLVLSTPHGYNDPGATKAKAAANTFLAAVKAKDLDAAMKVADVPFLLDLGGEEAQTFDKVDGLKAALKKLSEDVDTDRVPTDLRVVIEMPRIARISKETGAEKKYAAMEKFVGKTGYMVVKPPRENDKYETWVYVHIKDGKALVVGITK